MGLSLPDPNLFYLPRDNLPPEQYELILGPHHAWSHIDKEYVFDDRWSAGFQLINMQRRAVNGYTNQLPPHGPREREKLKGMVYSGEVVMLGGFSVRPGALFYINDDGELICRDPLVFTFQGAANIIRAFQLSVARRDYSQQGGKPRPTPLPSTAQQPAPLQTINSKMAGRLLAAGGVYHQNPEMFAETARKLGGEAAQGFDEVLNEQTAGTLIALSSLLMLGKASVAGHVSAANLEELNHYLGKSRGEVRLLHNIKVVKINYVRRDRMELAQLRRQFQTVKPKFYKMLAAHPEVKRRFNQEELTKLAMGQRPDEKWEIHHKLPLDDSGTNNFSNLVLIRRDYEHYVFNSAQKSITRKMASGEVKEVLWAAPAGLIFP
ncbi:HNH endonuclease signature motif containing protein [Mixta calida]|uniref:HNH endonuclease signature motif containing protein n=2 Tax=Mixta calida TaxID=665913 RepID=UPI0028AF0E12|nr:HNH endonuclease [Mixta calida]MDU3818532.1 HNH endonuclease [Pantoea sp.]